MKTSPWQNGNDLGRQGPGGLIGKELFERFFHDAGLGEGGGGERTDSIPKKGVLTTGVQDIALRFSRPRPTMMSSLCV